MCGMNEDVGKLRERILAEARSWVATPYQLGGRVKGVGADCVSLIYMVYENCGLVPAQEHGMVSQDWWLHTGEERYLLRVLNAWNQAQGRTVKVAKAQCFPNLNLQTGQIMMTKVAQSRVYNHGAIVTVWPLAVHCVYPAVEEVDITRHPMWACQEIATGDPWGNDLQACVSSDALR